MLRIMTNADALISQLKKYRESLENKMHLLLERLAAIGIDTADVRFRTAQYDGDNDVVVSNAPEWEGENELIISATGNAVTFIEFGTGVHYAEEHPAAERVGAVRGQFGQGKGSRDSWGYYGNPGTNGRVIKETDKGQVVITHGNPPNRAMYDAAKEMRNRIVEVAREVF